MGAQYLSIARLTAALAAEEIIVVGAESSFADAWDMMAELIDLGWDQLEAQEGVPLRRRWKCAVSLRVRGSLVRGAAVKLFSRVPRVRDPWQGCRGLPPCVRAGSQALVLLPPWSHRAFVRAHGSFRGRHRAVVGGPPHDAVGVGLAMY